MLYRWWLGRTTDVTVSPGYSGGQTTTPPAYNTTTYATTGSYTTKAQECYNSWCPELLNNESGNITLPWVTWEPAYYTEAPKYCTTKAPEYYTTTYAGYAALAYYTKAPHYYNTEELKYHTTTYAAPSYYIDVPKYVRKMSRLKKKKKSCSNCSALSVTNCISHRVTDSQLWVNILFFTLSFVSILFFPICKYAY